MIGGSEVSAAVVASAKEMLALRARRERVSWETTEVPHHRGSGVSREKQTNLRYPRKLCGEELSNSLERKRNKDESESEDRWRVSI